MDKNLLLFILLISIIFIAIITLILFIILITKLLNKGDVVVEEFIESDSNVNSIKYYATLKNTKKKQVTVKDFGVIVEPYKVPLLRTHFPSLEHGNLEILSKDTIKIDLSYLIGSKLLQNNKGKICYYYEDAYSDRYTFKSKLLKKYTKLNFNGNKKNIV